MKTSKILFVILCGMILSFGSSFAFAGNLVIITDDAPAAVGPYSQGKVIELGGGKMLFSAGQIAIDPATKKMADNKIALQTDQVMKNLVAILKAADMGPEDVVSVTVYLKKLADFKEFNLIYGKYFPENPPARETIGGVDLPLKALLEVSVKAYKATEKVQ